MSNISFRNSTSLSDRRLRRLCEQGASGWAVGRIFLNIRYSRGADFSGTCYYVDRRIYVNIGRHLVYPYLMATNLARAQTIGRTWYKPVYFIELRDGYEVALFIFMHELYHLLVKRAKRNTRQKESRCDRFAARYLADRFCCQVFDAGGRLVSRDQWDFQDVDGFVQAARDRRRRAVGRAVHGASTANQRASQLLLFPA